MQPDPPRTTGSAVGGHRDGFLDRHLWSRPWATRLQADFRLTIVTFFCLCSATIITPFAIHRFAVGQILIGMVDLASVLMFVGLALLGWRTGKSQLAGNLTAAVATLAVLTIVVILGLSHLWVFSTLMAIYLLAQRWVAVVSSSMVIAGTASQSRIFETTIDHLTFIAVAVMVSLFGLIFATRVDSQRGQLTEMAARDGLTGVFNRRALDRDLEMLIHGENADSRAMTMAIMDLDNFKPVNDNYGHDAGDQVLIQLTQIVTCATRQGDRFYRYGGEEFVLLLPDTDLSGARVALNNLMGILRKQLHSPGGPVTVSMGTAQRKPGESREAWLGRADQALFQAKRAGRDQNIVAE